MTFDELASKEWLLTNGIGGFASGTLAGCATRRYHSLLTVALDPPSGHRMSLLGGLDETVIIDGVEYPLATHLYEDGTVFPDGWERHASFGRGHFGPHWQYQLPIPSPFDGRPGYPGGTLIGRTIQFYPAKNAIRFEWHSLPIGAGIRIAPLVCWKDYHSDMQHWEGFPFRSEPCEGGWLVQATPDAPELRFYCPHGIWEPAGWWNDRIFHRREAERGFSATEGLYCPATLTMEKRRLLQPNPYVIASIENKRPAKRDLHNSEEPKPSLELIKWRKTLKGNQQWQQERIAAQFVVGAHDGRKTILAGYPWFTDWGRDTFISLPGLCLTTGREEIAKQIIRDFVPWVRDGRIPNRFPDNNDAPAYNNVDGTLWFVRCIGLCGLTDELSETVEAILTAHLDGTVGDGIYCDADGLLRCGDDHTNLTWMDAKVDGVAITPRFDRPVEVQALWINALKVAGKTELVAKAHTAFLARFVRAGGLGLYDSLFPDGTPDAAIRPNQVIAAALLDLGETVNHAVLSVATEHLLTPYGLRTLSPADTRFRPRYEGGPHQRDSSYHQGTVWPWLIGSFCDLYKKVHGADADVAPFLTELLRHQTEDYGLGGIAEVFDGAAPHRPNGCPWQAWSLAEVLRTYRAA
ncbi:amylo-alpha-1,6-glucosidase [Armatimonas sp.]|uniref:amylo-alpha-1,6-glucosidase n=1 Tax=Armatimonas sp. TaxID=1872638 RepID=UPI003753DF25